MGVLPAVVAIVTIRYAEMKQNYHPNRLVIQGVALQVIGFSAIMPLQKHLRTQSAKFTA
jgi:hypothetical protein